MRSISPASGAHSPVWTCAERAEDLHAHLPELGLELLGDRLVQVGAVGAAALVPEQLLDLDADREIGELHADDGVVGERHAVARGGPAVLHQLVEHPRVAGQRRLVLLLGTGVVGSSKRRDRVAAHPEPHLLPTLVEVAEHPVGGHADVVEEHQVLAAVGEVHRAAAARCPGVSIGVRK